MLKRATDTLLSAVGLIVLAPVFALIALWIKADSPGPVFYRGLRVGRFGRPFRIFKFRSMVHNAESIGPPNVAGDDTRVSRVGRLLRQTKLDELPQLISVLLGDMTLVGPRPELRMYVDMYTEEEERILEIKPGITDWASLVHYDQYVAFGKSDDPDKVYLDNIRPLKIRLQLYYLEHNSLPSDLRIIVYTILKLLLRNEWVPSEVKGLVDQFRRANAEDALPEDSSVTPNAGGEERTVGAT